MAFVIAIALWAAMMDGARLYRIPLTGILFTQLARNEGTSPEQRFFLVAPSGDRQPITDRPGSVPDTPEERANPTSGRITKYLQDTFKCP